MSSPWPSRDPTPDMANGSNDSSGQLRRPGLNRRGPGTPLARQEARGTGKPDSASLPELLRDLYVRQATGLLHFDRDGERISVRLINGQIVGGASSFEAQRLGETMLRHGLLSPADLAEALTIVLRSGRRLGPVLRELGMMGQERLEAAIALRVTQVLSVALSWTDGVHSFETKEVPIPPTEDLTLKACSGELILRAVRAMSDVDEIGSRLGSLEHVPVQSADPLLRSQHLSLTPAETCVLSSLNPSLTVGDLVERMSIAPGETKRALLGLLCTGLAQYVPETSRPQEASTSLREEILEVYAGLHTKNHFEILHLPVSASPTEIKSAYVRLVKRFHPDTQSDHAVAGLTDELHAILLRVCEAHSVLRSPDLRARYEATLPAGSRSHDDPVTAPPPTSHVAARSASPPPQPDPSLTEGTAVAALAEAEAHFAQARYWDAITTLEPIVKVGCCWPAPTRRTLIG